MLDARRGVEIVLARSAARFVTRDAADAFHRPLSAWRTPCATTTSLDFWLPTRRWTRRWPRAADNPFAARLAAPLQTHSRRFWFRYQASTGLAEAAEHHVHIIQAVLEADEERAGRETDRLIALLRLHAEAAVRR